MSYQSSDKTRQKKDAKRTAMMKAAVRVFSQKGYYAATIRDIVADAQVSIGTFYFYFPDKETLFLHLYEETAEFLLQTITQAIHRHNHLPEQIGGGIQAYLRIAVYEPAVIQLLLVGGIGAVPSLTHKRAAFRDALADTWQRPLLTAIQQGAIPPQNSRRAAEALAGAFDEVTLHLLAHPDPEREVNTAIQELTQFALQAIGYTGAAT
jgi:AcrR family transcriptional regulator